MRENATGHIAAFTRAVEFKALRVETQEDIAAYVIDKSTYLSGEGWTECDLREFLLDLVEAIWLPVIQVRVSLLRRLSANRAYSTVALEKLTNTLVANGELHPVIVDEASLVNGRHRLEAYARFGRQTIPAVQVGPLLRIDWEDWMNG